MRQEERIILLCKARSILESKGRVSVSEARDLVVRVLDDLVEDSMRNARPE